MVSTPGRIGYAQAPTGSAETGGGGGGEAGGGVDEVGRRHGGGAVLGAVEGGRGVPLGVVVEEDPAAGRAGHERFGDAEGDRGGHGGVDRVAPVAQHIETRPGGG